MSAEEADKVPEEEAAPIAGEEGEEIDAVEGEEVDGDEGDSEKRSLKESVGSFLAAEGRPIQWILDRCNGHERVMNPDSKPCCCLLYPNGFLKLAPGLFESNCFMEWFGRVGFIKPEWFLVRRSLFFIVMLFSTVGWICMLLADMAMSKQFEVLQKFDFSNAKVYFAYATEGFADGLGQFIEGTSKIHVGVRAVAWEREIVNISFEQIDKLYTDNNENPSDADWDELIKDNTIFQETVTGFSDFCSGDNRVFFVKPEQCDACEKVSDKLIRGLIMPTIFYFFTFKNDWLRFWPNYDVNCQKAMSFFVGSITIALALRTFFVYKNECFGSFREGEYCFNLDGTEAECPLIYTSANDDFADDDLRQAEKISYSEIDWEAGAGYILLGTAVFIRLFSMLCNLSVPTPSITRDREEQWEYERIAKAQDKATSEYFLPW